MAPRALLLKSWSSCLSSGLAKPDHMTFWTEPPPFLSLQPSRSLAGCLLRTHTGFLFPLLGNPPRDVGKPNLVEEARYQRAKASVNVASKMGQGACHGTNTRMAQRKRPDRAFTGGTTRKDKGPS
jgi:hypothetical protein